MQLLDKIDVKNARIDILPLIDVVFLLLVFFIVMFINMTVQQGLPVTLPELSTPETIKQDSLQVTINNAGLISVDGTPFSLNKFERHLRKISHFSQRPIVIHGDRKTELGTALQVLETLTLAGFSNISFAANKRERPVDTVH